MIERLDAQCRPAAVVLERAGRDDHVVVGRQIRVVHLENEPGIDNGLKLFDSAVVTDALRQATGIDFAGLRSDITQKASDGIYNAIAREEIAIRADPLSTNDPLLIGVFALTKRG